MVLEDGYVAVSNRGKDWLVDPDYSVPFIYPGLVPSSLASASSAVRAALVAARS